MNLYICKSIRCTGSLLLPCLAVPQALQQFLYQQCLFCASSLSGRDIHDSSRTQARTSQQVKCCIYTAGV
jgi:hypothetical protein